MHVKHFVRGLSFGLWLTLCALTAQASTTYSGYLNDCAANTALYSSDLGSPLCGDDNDIANNVALYTFNLASPEVVELISTGFANGGFFPYLTLFTGTGPGATFLLSNYASVFDPTLPPGDYGIGPVSLGAGDFTVAISAFANMSLAENLGAPYLLGDGFAALGDPLGFPLGNYLYEVEVRAGSVPEPISIALVGIACIGLTFSRRRGGRRDVAFAGVS